MKKRLLLCLAALLLAILPAALAEDEEVSYTDILVSLGEENPAADTGDAAQTAAAEQEIVQEEDGSILLTMSFTGDVTIGGDVRKNSSIFETELKKQGDDLSFCFRNVRDIFAADDMTLVNFEGTLTTAPINSAKSGNSFLFSAPPSYVEILTSGNVDAVSLENNHVMDHGEAGYEETMATLDEAGIVHSGHTGMGVFTAKGGVEIAMLSYQTFDAYDTLFTQVPIDVAAAKAEYPIVIVSFHWGAEKDYSPNANQQKMAKIAIDAGADLIIGHHSHRINPIEVYNGKYICYSLGNFSFAGNNKPDDMSTFIFQTRFRVAADGAVTQEGFRIIPCRISSRTDYNDFAPTPYTKQENIDALLLVLKNNSTKLENPVAEYPLEW